MGFEMRCKSSSHFIECKIVFKLPIKPQFDEKKASFIVCVKSYGSNGLELCAFDHSATPPVEFPNRSISQKMCLATKLALETLPKVINQKPICEGRFCRNIAFLSRRLRAKFRFGSHFFPD